MKPDTYDEVVAQRDTARAEVERWRQEAHAYRETNESVAVCANHTEDILYSDDCPCVICELQTAQADLAALRSRHAEAVEAAFRAGYHANWLKDEQRYIFDPALKPGDPDGAYAAWLASDAKARLT